MRARRSCFSPPCITRGLPETATLQLEERLIRQALERCRWRRGDAAEALGLNLRTLQRKMKRQAWGDRGMRRFGGGEGTFLEKVA